MSAPLWLAILLLGAAAWSTFQLFAFDTILDRPRRKILRMGDWQQEGDEVSDDYRLEWGIWLTCPYCAGFWIWMGWLAAFWISDWTLYAALFMGGRAMVVAGHKLLAKDEDR
jgi:hypothetical protein